MARYWVIGGEYADTAFEQIAGGAEEERIGPFESYEAPGCWVVGGHYKDTHFREPASPAGET